MGSLNAATTTGPGASVDLVTPRRSVRMVTTVTGSPSAVVVNFEGSLDGTTWTVLGTTTGNAVSNMLPGGPYTDTVTSVGPDVRYIRANMVTLTGGTSPTVSAACMPIAGPW